jgi:hypothetical protein
VGDGVEGLPALGEAGQPAELTGRSLLSIEAEKVRATSALSSVTKRENGLGSRSM